ncbi:MAG: thioredoxin domain-containing protein, partial [Chloroflexi bacterium]|nr:thioredoxin domain-containing protein [Chloroflexota bacterium]
RLLAALQSDDIQRAGDISPALLASAQASLASGYDDLNGGWGGAPKFPQPMAIEFLLRRYVRTGDDSALSMATSTLEKMARGGIYDHLGGGFHRYAVDAIWLVPHFEKMLYDNSQIVRAYLKAWQVTGEPLFRQVVEETLDYVIDEMTNPDGGFYSTLDADSEGEEGKYYVWDRSEVREVLGADAETLIVAYDVSENGNFEGRSILNRPLDHDVVAHLLDMETSKLDERLAVSKKALLERRAQRIRPGLDDKVLTSWNGLMLAAFADAARALDNPAYLTAARRNARFILSELRTPEGRLLRTWKDGRASLNGYLEDYSYLLEGLLALYQATFEPEWFAAAREIADVMIERFADPQGGFFDTSDDHERLITRPKNVQDNATPSGGAMAATALFRLTGLTGEARYAEAAAGGIKQVSGIADKHPTAFGQWLNAMDYYLGDPLEVAIIGDPKSGDTRELLDVVFEGFRPGVVAAAGEETDISPVPLLSRRPRIDGKATAYVCRNFVCNLPVTSADDLRSQL